MSKTNSDSVRDYLKRYTDPAPVSSDYKERKKKKKKKNVKQTKGFVVVDVDQKNRVLSTAKVQDLSEESSEEAPTIVKVEEEENNQEPKPRGVYKSIEISFGMGSDKLREDADLELPRKPKKTPLVDLDPPRPDKKIFGPVPQDLDLPRKPKLEDNGDLELPRKSKNDGNRDDQNDLAPPRKSRKAEDGHPIKQPDLQVVAVKPPTKKPVDEPDSTRAGLLTADQFSREEEAKAKRQLQEIRKQDPRALGRGAATVYRDAKGRPLAMLNAMISGQSEEQDMEWGVGRKDKNAEEEQQRHEKELEEEGSMYRGIEKNDPQRHKEAAELIRFGDPMAKKLKQTTGSSKKLKLYTRAFPANRFNIRPGWRWDGVDRSNHFEAKVFAMINEREIRTEQLMYEAQRDM